MSFNMASQVSSPLASILDNWYGSLGRPPKFFLLGLLYVIVFGRLMVSGGAKEGRAGQGRAVAPLTLSCVYIYVHIEIENI